MAKKSSKSMGLGRKQSMSGWQLLTFALVVGAIGGVVSWAAFAAPAKGGGGGKTSGATVTGPVMVTDNNGDGQPNFGDTITFNVTDSASFASVLLSCYQNGSLVMTATRGYYPTYFWSDNVLLNGGYWSSGAADCTATLYHTSKGGKNITDATLNFHVNA